MGWTGTKRHGQPIKEFLRGEVDCVNDFGSWKVLDIAIVKFRTAYMAVELIKKNKDTGVLDPETRRVVAFVFLLQYTPRALDGYDIYYKPMDETVGPYEVNCPERILKLLTPTVPSENYAQEWREKCWANVKKRAAFKLVKGATIHTKPIYFTDGSCRELFRVESVRPLRLWGVNSGVMYLCSRETLRENFISMEEQNNENQQG